MRDDAAIASSTKQFSSLTLNCFVAELVLGPATSGRTRRLRTNDALENGAYLPQPKR